MSTGQSWRRLSECRQTRSGQGSLAGPGHRASSPAALRCRAKFLRFYPEGFHDATYLDWERSSKWVAHERWEGALAPALYESLLKQDRFTEIAAHAFRIVSRRICCPPAEKMAIRDAVRSSDGARGFAEGLFAYLSVEAGQTGFEGWVGTLAALPHKQNRLLTWPMVTIFGFIARPDRHIFLKPVVTSRRGERIPVRFHVSHRARLGDLREPPRIRGADSAGHRGPRAPGHDRPAGVHAGPGIGRIPGGVIIRARSDRCARTSRRVRPP
jgi:hypothetical protein